MSGDDLPAEFEPRVFAEEWTIRSIIERAFQRIRETSVDPGEARLLRQIIKDLFLNFRILDEIRNPVVRDTILDVIGEAYRLGMFSGSKEIADDLRKRGSSKGGRLGARTRNDAADTGWRRHATVLAIELRKKRPGITQKDSAAEIQNLWRESEIKPPGFDTLVDHVRKLEKSGRLPKRSKV